MYKSTVEQVSKPDNVSARSGCWDGLYPCSLTQIATVPIRTALMRIPIRTLQLRYYEVASIF